MSRFENKLCPACKAPFMPKADIVVCPICGTPHHRNCYLSAGKCALEEYHEQGFVWEGYLPDEPRPKITLEKDDGSVGFDGAFHASYPEGTPGGSVIDDDDDEEENISFEELEMQAYTAFFGDADYEQQGEDSVTMLELISYTSRSLFHYGRAYKAFRGDTPDGKKHKVFINLCSGLLAPVFQFYRKMDLFGVLVFVLTLLPHFVLYSDFFPMERFNSDAQTIITIACNVLSYGQMILLCLFGDYLYYRKAVKKIKKIRAEFGGERSMEYYRALSEVGRPSWVRAIIGFLAFALCALSLTVLPAAVWGAATTLAG